MPPKRKLDSSQIIDLTGDDEGHPVPSKKTAPSRHSGFVKQENRHSHASQASANATSGDWNDENSIELTQDRSPDLEYYGSLDSKIVGIRYYRGYASAGEIVNCVREPSNPYDNNAIQITNVLNEQVGHLPRTVAAKLAPYIDAGDIAVEPMLTGEKGFYDCPVRLGLYGPSSRWLRPSIEERLKKDKLLKATQLKKSKEEAEARRKALGLKSSQSSVGLAVGEQVPSITLEQLQQSSESVNLRKDGDAIKALAMGEDELEKMPLAEQPAVLKAQLLPYQLQGLAWMSSKEHPQLPEKKSSDAVQLWRWHENGRGMWNIATNFFISGEAKLLSGGILADDMGLGKTLQIISLILMGGGTGPTLIIAPVSVMSNWQQQIERHVLPEHVPSVLIYHSSNPNSTENFDKYDVVVTSYGKLTREKDVRGPLMNTKWRRVVLDEGHTIRNAKTNAAQAACQLKAESRWVLTGTPIVNNVKDLQSMLAFLHMTGGVEQPSIFNSVIARPLGFGNETAELLLQNIMHDLCLRRRKDMKFVDLKLPPKTEYVHRIQFRDDEKTKYSALMDEARGALEDYQNNTTKGGKGQFQGVLERLLRLRQLCNHWTLCRKRIDDLLKLLENEEVVPLTDENKSVLQEALRLVVETQEECPVCYEPLKEPVITHCKHVYCKTCITKVIELQHKCPMCRNVLEEGHLLEPEPEPEVDQTFDADTKSSKTEAFLKILQATCKNPGSKVVVFSQWTSFLNILQAQLDEAGYKYTRVDGTMRADRRDTAIAALDNDPDTRIMLASLAVCSVGLNLVSADTVVLADSWWAPAIEDQAVDRCHRLGQTRPVTVWRLVVEGSVEERVLDIQADKRALVTKAFKEKNGEKKAKETRMADVLKLLS